MRDVQNEILDFWFVKSKPKQWFQKNEDFDLLIKGQFESAYHLARDGIFDGWLKEPEGCLAYIILFDQFSRNMFRGTPQMFETDSLALKAAQHAVQKHFDKTFEAVKKRFIYLPFEHSEDLEDQEMSVALFMEIKNEDPIGYEHALQHYEVIHKFGRFPSRNEVLQRKSTNEELEYISNNSEGF